jgi:hypothetical protein
LRLQDLASALMATLSYFADIDPVLPQDCILHAAP